MADGVDDYALEARPLSVGHVERLTNRLREVLPDAHAVAAVDQLEAVVGVHTGGGLSDAEGVFCSTTGVVPRGAVVATKGRVACLRGRRGELSWRAT